MSKNLDRFCSSMIDVEADQINQFPSKETSSVRTLKLDVEFEQDYQLPLLPTLNFMSDERRQEYAKYGIRLYRAALHGDWETARQIHKEHPNCFMEKISKYGDTALHIAAARGHTHFVKQAIAHAKFTIEQLEIRNDVGNTAFCLAAASGAIEIVKEMEQRSPKLPYIPGSNYLRPILMAALLGHKDMVMHLLPSFDHLSQDERIDLLISTINTDLYGVALHILQKDDSLAILRNGDGETPLHVLACKPRNQSPKRSYNIFTNLFGAQADESTKLQLVEYLWNKVIQQPKSVLSDVLSSPQPRLLFAAIEKGNHEFVAILIHHYPDLIWELDDENRTIFHAAIHFRQEKIFGHIYEIDGINHLLTAQRNPANGNNILHLAATLPPADRLNALSGAALQMQRELLWFQVVKEVVRPEFVDLKNNYGETPRALFTKEHKELRKEGEKWMRSTAISCMLVATLVAIIVFHATFQVPKNMHPNYSNSSLLVMLEAFSLLASVASILTFLSILSSRFAEEDFLKLLPLKLIIGLLLLIFSMTTMLLTFTVTVFTMFQHQVGWIVIVILAWITCTFYIWQNLPLLVDMFSSVLGSRYRFRPRHNLF